MKKVICKIMFITLVFCTVYPFNSHAQELDISKFDKAKILEIMDLIAAFDLGRPNFKNNPDKFTKEFSNLSGSFSAATAVVDNGYYGVSAGLRRVIDLTYTKPGMLATYGGDNVLNIKTNSPLLVVVSGGSNKFKVEKTGGFTGGVYFVTHYASGTIEGATSEMSFKDFWAKYR